MTQGQFRTFGQVLRHLREKKGMSYTEVGDLTRADKRRVKAWEGDVPPHPNTLQLKALYACFPQLKHFTHLIPKEPMSSLAFKVRKGIEDAGVAAARAHRRGNDPVHAGEEAFNQEVRWIPPADKAPLPAADAAPLPRPKTFGEALRQARVREGLSAAELGALLKVTESSVNKWESGENAPIADHHAALLALLPVLSAAPPINNKDMEKPGRVAGQEVNGNAWRGRVREALDRADADVSGAAFGVRALVDLPETTARQVAEALNKLIDWARALKTALPIHVVEHERSYPGTAPESAPAAELGKQVLSPSDHRVAADYGWRRCATLGGKGHLWNPAPGAVPPKSTDGLPEVTCPHHAKAAQPVPDLPGAIGAGARYGAAMVELARAAMIRRGAEAFYEEAKLGEEIAQEELAKAKAALDGAADKEATDAA